MSDNHPEDVKVLAEMLTRAGIEFEIDYNNQKPSEMFINNVCTPNGLVDIMVCFTQDGMLEVIYVQDLVH